MTGQAAAQLGVASRMTGRSPDTALGASTSAPRADALGPGPGQSP